MATVFVTVYDITVAPFPWLEVAVPLLVVVGSALSWLAWLKHRRPESRLWRQWAWAGVVLSIVLGSLAGGYITFRSLIYRRALSQGRTCVVEGLVHDFKPEPSSGRGEETFSVADKTFWLSRGVAVPGFNQTREFGSPIREGLYVRIHYVGNNILKLEVKRDVGSSSRTQ